MTRLFLLTVGAVMIGWGTPKKSEIGNSASIETRGQFRNSLEQFRFDPSIGIIDSGFFISSDSLFKTEVTGNISIEYLNGVQLKPGECLTVDSSYALIRCHAIVRAKGAWNDTAQNTETVLIPIKAR